ncbi:MAG: S41 family peptidase, partial [Patescibacteria group bacterium]|nr:S41 family peptidase [Patescibacteria group bacterium]
SPLKGMILDLRNNPGGYLDGSVYIASEFISSGIVVSQKNSDGSVQNLRVNRKGRILDIPLVVLINKGSASASEIVAGALKDYKRATLVGEKSFGKGSVQTPFELKEGASVHITTGKWLLPNGDSISEKGVVPDIEAVYDYSDPKGDEQLSQAIQVLLRNSR